jgi:hypothetical protein
MGHFIFHDIDENVYTGGMDDEELEKEIPLFHSGFPVNHLTGDSSGKYFI